MKKILLGFISLTMIVMQVACTKESYISNGGKQVMQKLDCQRPTYLKAGDKVALISPSYSTPMENVEKTSEVLRGWGLVPVVGANVGKLYKGKYAGTVAERVSDLRWALKDPEIKAIICNRGGYGAIHLVDEMQLKEFSVSPKWLVGFSDITTLHGMLQDAGVMSIHGTMSSFLAKGGKDASSLLMRDILMGKIPRYEVEAHPQNITGKARGVLVGGNICTLVPLLGTKADATAHKDIILFVEEVEELMHNLDRQLNMLKFNGVLNRCRGVVLGEFTDCGKDLDFESVEQLYHQYFKEYNIPVLCGFPGGHGKVNLPLIFGAPVTIDVRNDGATLSFDIDGIQNTVRTAEMIGQVNENALDFEENPFQSSTDENK